MRIMKRTMLFVLALLLVPGLLGCLAAHGAQSTEAVSAVTYLNEIPACWNPLAQQSAAGDQILSLTAGQLYTVSEEGEVLPQLAAALPGDVTAEYAGTYGIPAGADRGYAFTIDLSDQALWQDGAAVTAGEYAYAARLMVDRLPLLANAAEYLAGRERPAEAVISLEEAGFSDLSEAESAGYTEFYVDLTNFWGLDGGWMPIGDRARFQDDAIASGIPERFVTPAYIYHNYLAAGMDLDFFQSGALGVTANFEDKLTIDDVGILVSGERQLTLILAEPTTASALALALEDLYPIRQALYEADPEGYGTSPETWLSCGPYMVTAVSAGEIRLERNPHWPGETEADVLLCRPFTDSLPLISD